MKFLPFIENIVVIISFTVLACVFGKWWIVLFSILFMWTRFEKDDKKDGDSQ